MSDSTVAVRAALALYPVRYRRERGDELADVFTDTTAQAGLAARVRELLDLGAYGLRMRTGLTSTSAGGRLAALAAPLVVGAVAGLAGGLTLVAYLTGGVGGLPAPSWGLRYFLPFWGLLGAALLSAGAALLGRWTAAKLLAGMAALAAVADLVLQTTEPLTVQPLWNFLLAFQWDGPFVLWALVLLAAPKDALPVPTWRERSLMAASAVLFPAVTFSLGFYRTWHFLDPQWRALMVVVPLLMTLSAVRGWYLVAVPGLVALPWAFSVNLHALWQQEGGAWRLLPMAGVVVAASVALVLAGRRKGAAAGPGGRLPA